MHVLAAKVIDWFHSRDAGADYEEADLGSLTRILDVRRLREQT